MGNLFNSTGYPVYCDEIVSSNGCYVYDKTGKSYFDMEAGVWCLPLGHNHPGLAAAMRDQMDKVCHAGYKYNHSAGEEAAGKLVDISGFQNGKCVFLSSGSEAVEYGIQLAKGLRPGLKCISLAGQYLSAYGYGANTADNREWICIPWERGQVKSTEEWYWELTGMIDFKEMGVFVFEAGNSSGLVKLPPRNLVKALSRLIREFRLLVVADEVTCGMGRTGKWFGYMNYEIEPHIIAAGKGLGNGYPVSAVILREGIAEEAIKTGFHYAQSHQNDPLGCRIALEVIKIMEEEKLLERAVTLGGYVRSKYREMKESFPEIEEINGIGLLNSLRFSRAVTPDDLERMDRELFEGGFIVGMKPAQRTLRTYPPLVAETSMIDSYISALRSCLKKG